MAKKLGKKAQKKGMDTRDWIVIGLYVLLFTVVGFLGYRTSVGTKGVDAEKKKLADIEKAMKNVKNSLKSLKKQTKSIDSSLSNSRAKLEKEKRDYEIVVGTSLAYAQKSKLLAAIWESISTVGSMALKKVKMSKNQIELEVIAESNAVITEFVGEMYKRKDLVSSILPGEVKREKKGGKKGLGKEVLFGSIKIEAKRPRGSSAIEPQTPATGQAQANAQTEEKKEPEKGTSKSKKKGSRRKRKRKKK
jgi:hypothetical protein